MQLVALSGDEECLSDEINRFMLFIQIAFIIFIPAVTFKMLDLLHCFIIPVLLVHGFSTVGGLESTWRSIGPLLHAYISQRLCLAAGIQMSCGLSFMLEHSGAFRPSPPPCFTSA